MNWRQWLAWKVFGTRYVLIVLPETASRLGSAYVVPCMTSPIGEIVVQVDGHTLILSAGGEIQGARSGATWRHLTPDAPPPEKPKPAAGVERPVKQITHVKDLTIDDIVQIGERDKEAGERYGR